MAWTIGMICLLITIFGFPVAITAGSRKSDMGFVAFYIFVVFVGLIASFFIK